LWRFILTIFSAISGLFGLSIGLILLVLHLAYIETFGVPYLSPYVGNEGKEITLDTILRLPIWLMKNRTKSLKPINIRRQG
jgi:spore germination protein KA